MTLEEAVAYHLVNTAGITALIGTRAYPPVIPQDATMPAVEYQRISGPRMLVHEGAAGMAWGRMQITAVGSTYASAKGVIGAVRTAFNGFKGLMGGAGGVTIEECQVENEVDGYGAGSEKKTVRMDVVFLYLE
jgi:hypothetical protein